ncbi:Phytoene synthase [Methylophaga frappieri]|uniref:Phytoene synthase n=1 Tax=Methylophaga frappieri (strain ATCC BAA-2434 / DSM 25690 / JAM7) TaxID=754477 RepID=I1YGW4_METFJ|nr:squalene synthase HpnC [Methylophaga frappieri]AFJ02157.1 Phytoene synthase [Methylophaga frappieri]
MTTTDKAINQAYRYCQQLANSHYENFPVASILLPRQLRKPVSAIYAFARTADDIADEGTAPPEQRLANLNYYRSLLTQIEQEKYAGNDPIFIALQDAVNRYTLPVSLFADLLTAFEQDVVKNRYADFAELHRYCRYSANPVGRLVLHLHGAPDSEQLIQSDAICTSLQLINFFQDIVQDKIEQNRIYLPQDALSAAGISESALFTDKRALACILRPLYQKTAQILSAGIPLGAHLSGRLGWEIRGVILGGLITLKKLQNQLDADLLSRPRLSRMTQLQLLINSASPDRYLRVAYKFS